MKQINYYFYGFGGVGGFFGSILLAALDKNLLDKKLVTVTFITRDETAKSLIQDGIVLKSQLFGDHHFKDFSVIPSNKLKYLPENSVIFICTKTYHIPEVANILKNKIPNSARIVTLQNGVSTHEYLQKYFNNEIVNPGMCWIVSERDNLNTIIQSAGQCKIYFGTGTGIRDKLLLATAKDLTTASNGILNECYSDSVYDMLWQKYVFMLAFSGVTAYFKKTIGEILSEKDTYSFTMKVLQESFILAAVSGYPISEPAKEIIKNRIDNYLTINGHATSSMARDIMAGKQSEIEVMHGYASRLGEKHGLELECIQEIYNMLQSSGYKLDEN